MSVTVAPKVFPTHTAFSSRCAKKAEATWKKRERRIREPARRTTKAAEPSSGANGTALGLSLRAPEEGERSGS